MAAVDPTSPQDWTQLDDAILVRAHLKGDRGAFEVLFKKHRAGLARLAFSIVKDQTLVEDIVQEVFLLVHRFLSKFREESSFKTWVYRITVNEAIRQRARSKRWVAVPPRELEERIPPTTMVVVRHEPSPERLLLEGEERRMIHDALAALKPNHRVILSLYYLEELSIQEIVEILEIPEGSVKSRLFYARDNLKNCLQRAAGDWKPLDEIAHHGL